MNSVFCTTSVKNAKTEIPADDFNRFKIFNNDLYENNKSDRRINV